MPQELLSIIKFMERAYLKSSEEDIRLSFGMLTEGNLSLAGTIWDRFPFTIIGMEEKFPSLRPFPQYLIDE